MDVSSRYADKTGLIKALGQERRHDKLLDVLFWCMDLNIRKMTLYSFSIENLKRKKSEVLVIMQLFKQKIEELLEEKYISNVLSNMLQYRRISPNMYTYNSTNPDLLIRSSGETRIPHVADLLYLYLPYRWIVA